MGKSVPIFLAVKPQNFQQTFPSTISTNSTILNINKLAILKCYHNLPHFSTKFERLGKLQLIFHIFFHTSTKRPCVKMLLISDVECVERVGSQTCVVFLDEKCWLLLFFFQLLTPALSCAQPLAGRICHVAPEKQAIHTFTCSLVASLAFPLQSYCGLPTRKAETSCLRKFSSPCGVVIPGQALL